jgi:hypothetical protein
LRVLNNIVKKIEKDIDKCRLVWHNIGSKREKGGNRNKTKKER